MNVPIQLTFGINPAHHNQYLFSDHYLNNLLPQDPRWDAALPEAGAFLAWLQRLYAQEQEQLSKYNENQLEEHWFKPILSQLGHVFEGQASVPGLNAGVKHPDYVFFPDETTRQAAVGAQKTEEYAANALSVGEVKRWDVPLSKKQKGGGASFEAQNPSWQIDYYVRATDLGWGILSNGRLWRLVHKDTSQRLSIHYEVDLVDLLGRGDAGAMCYFTLFFRQAAFRPDAQGRVFLPDALAASMAYAVALEEDLEANVYQALERLMQGFLDLPANGLGADDLRRIYENSLYLLYRLLFILYGETRGLLPMNRDSYRDNYSLDLIKREIAELKTPPVPMTTIYWGRLKQLFQIINGDNAELNRHMGVPRYNGRLFSPELHPFLEQYAVGDRALTDAIDLLSRRTTAAGREFVDYRTLGVRHLGSIYEGLLEYQPRCATEAMVTVSDRKGERWVGEADLERPLGSRKTPRVVDRREAGQVYLETDRGERKATGSYYTPQYIVEYIVENTLGPLVEEATERVRDRAKEAKSGIARAAAEQSLIDEILSLKVLDPAMGSGHFLVEATDYLALALATDPYVETEVSVEEDLLHWKRRVVERCIYGVDKNPLAVELAKLSLWLATVAADKPLSFLDHHLQCGDSLIGARVEDLGEVPPVMLNKKVLGERKARYNAGVRQANLFETRLTEKLPVVMGRILEITEVESKDYDTVRAKEATDQAVRQLKAPFQAVANLWTSAYFGNEFINGEYDEALMQISQPDALMALDAMQRAQTIADVRRFFHWELAFPEVFYDRHGQALRDAAGFDAVVGNPPYFNVDVLPTDYLTALQHLYPEVHNNQNDILYYFLVRSAELLEDGGNFAMIVARYFLEARVASKLRGYLARSVELRSILDFRNAQVWPDVNVLTLIVMFSPLIGEPASPNTLIAVRIRDDHASALPAIVRKLSKLQSTGPLLTTADFGLFTVSQAQLGTSSWLFAPDVIRHIKTEMRRISLPLSSLLRSGQGMKSGRNEIFVVDEETITRFGIERHLLRKYIKTRDIQPYSVSWRGLYLIYTYNETDIDDFPAAKRYLTEHRQELETRYQFQDGTCKWFALSIPQNRELFETPEKILNPLYATRNKFALDSAIESGGLVGLTDVYALAPTVKDAGYSLKYFVALLNSNSLDFWAKHSAKLKRGGYYEYSSATLDPMPIRRIEFTTPADEREQLVREAKAKTEEAVRALVVSGVASSDSPLDRVMLLNAASPVLEFVRERLAAQPDQSDVVHDLLAHLAEQMMAMNKQKHATLEAFWLDLEGVTEATAFDILRNKGKHERTLWKKAEACRTFVREESHSTRRLDESLGWNEEAFKAFVKILVGKVQGLSDLVGVYRAHSPAYRELVARIEATDWLIDQIVYRLYGLTEEEIAIVEGS